MSFTVVIPSRYRSERLPAKAVADIAGTPMIVRVAAQAARSGATRVVVATDDDRIAAACEGQVEVCMTRADHESGTDRLEEAASLLELADDAIVVNVQGDEPLIPPPVIDQVAANLEASGAAMATLSVALSNREELFDPNVVKVVTGDDGLALYFSRAPIPWSRDHFGGASGAGGALDEQFARGSWQRHIGLYAYRVATLHRFVGMAPGRLEQMEKLEQLRALAAGLPIHVGEAVQAVPAGVDTPADLARVRTLVGE